MLDESDEHEILLHCSKQTSKLSVTHKTFVPKCKSIIQEYLKQNNKEVDASTMDQLAESCRVDKACVLLYNDTLIYLIDHYSNKNLSITKDIIEETTMRFAHKYNIQGEYIQSILNRMIRKFQI